MQANKLSKEELEKALSEALLPYSSKELLREFDKGHKGRVARLEFRQGAREVFGLDFDNKDLDDWFSR